MSDAPLKSAPRASVARRLLFELDAGSLEKAADVARHNSTWAHAALLLEAGVKLCGRLWWTGRPMQGLDAATSDDLRKLEKAVHDGESRFAAGETNRLMANHGAEGENVRRRLVDLVVEWHKAFRQARSRLFLAALESKDVDTALQMAENSICNLAKPLLMCGKQLSVLKGNRNGTQNAAQGSRRLESVAPTELSSLEEQCRLQIHMLRGEAVEGQPAGEDREAYTRVCRWADEWIKELQRARAQAAARESDERKAEQVNASQPSTVQADVEDEQHQSVNQARLKRHVEVMNRFLSVLKPEAHGDPGHRPESEEDRRERAFVESQVPLEVLKKASEQGVFRADGEGRLLVSSQMLRGVDVPAGFDSPEFVKPFYFYCVLCTKALDYWEQLPEHMSGSLHRSRRLKFENAARDAYTLYQHQSFERHPVIVISSQKKTYSCRLCRIRAAPWHEAAQHVASLDHLAAVAEEREKPVEARPGDQNEAGSKPSAGLPAEVPEAKRQRTTESLHESFLAAVGIS